jgi:hypothetical protein
LILATDANIERMLVLAKAQEMQPARAPSPSPASVSLPPNASNYKDFLELLRG